MKHDLIFYENRRTPEVVPIGASAKFSGGAAGKFIKRRAATDKEEKTIAGGNWVRVNVKGSTPSNPKYKTEVKSKIRPQNN